MNYNSAGFIDVALRSLNFDGYKLFIVDNASCDGSFKVIKKYIDEHKKNVKVKVIKNDRNLGYAGVMNVS